MVAKKQRKQQILILPSMGTRVLCIVGLCLFFVTACQTVEERQKRVLNVIDQATSTASGAVSDVQSQVDAAIGLGTSIHDAIDSVVTDVKDRVDTISSGVDLLLQGTDLIEEGISQ